MSLRAQSDLKYDRFCKLTSRKIIKKKMSLGPHNFLMDILINFSFCAYADLSSRNKMALIIRADKFSLSFNFVHLGGGGGRGVLREF